MRIWQPDGPRPIVDATNTTVEDLTSDFLAAKDALVRLSKRAQSADASEMESEYRATLKLAEDLAKSYESAIKRIRWDFANTVRKVRDSKKRRAVDRRIERRAADVFGPTPGTQPASPSGTV